MSLNLKRDNVNVTCACVEKVFSIIVQFAVLCNIYTKQLSCSKLSEKLKKDIQILVSQSVLELLIRAITNYSRTVWPTQMLMSFLNFLDKIFIFFNVKKINNFEIEHKIY